MGFWQVPDRLPETDDSGCVIPSRCHVDTRCANEGPTCPCAPLSREFVRVARDSHIVERSMPTSRSPFSLLPQQGLFSPRQQAPWYSPHASRNGTISGGGGSLALNRKACSHPWRRNPTARAVASDRWLAMVQLFLGQGSLYRRPRGAEDSQEGRQNKTPRQALLRVLARSGRGELQRVLQTCKPMAQA